MKNNHNLVPKNLNLVSKKIATEIQVNTKKKYFECQKNQFSAEKI